MAYRTSSLILSATMSYRWHHCRWKLLILNHRPYVPIRTCYILCHSNFERSPFSSVNLSQETKTWSSFHMSRCLTFSLAVRSPQATSIRYYSAENEDVVKPPNRPKRFLIDKLLAFLDGIAERLERKIPKVFSVYNTFRTGLSSFVSDSKEFMSISSRLWAGKSLKEFSRKELRLYREFSSTLPRVGFLLMMAVAPGGAFVFPVAYFFPRKLLSHHFWTPEQRDLFVRYELLLRVKELDKVAKGLHELTREIDDEKLHKTIGSILYQIDHSVKIQPSEIMKIAPLFSNKPYRLSFLPRKHVKHLGKSLGFGQSKTKLVKDAQLLHYIDLAMLKEDIDALSEVELDKACLARCLNPRGLKREEKLQYLKDWTEISKHLHEEDLSLLLHLPVFMAYPHRNNVQLKQELKKSSSSGVK